MRHGDCPLFSARLAPQRGALRGLGPSALRNLRWQKLSLRAESWASLTSIGIGFLRVPAASQTPCRGPPIGVGAAAISRKYLLRLN
jgi:hypothetical protein